MNIKRQIVCIDWIDAALTGTDQMSRRVACDAGLVHGFAVGILVNEDKDKVVIAMDWFDVDDEYRTVSVYPKTGIKKITRYEIFEPITNIKAPKKPLKSIKTKPATSGSKKKGLISK